MALVRAFLTVVEAGGVTRAAIALGMSQAAASQQIKRLEEALDCRLFVRQGRGLVLAPAGERLLEQARRLVAMNDEVWSSMRAPMMFSDKDPVTAGGERFFRELIPSAKAEPEITIHDAGHFLQEDKGEEIAERIVEFIQRRPLS